MLTKFTTGKYIEDFLKAMMADAGMDKLPANVQDQMLSDLYARLEDWLFGHIVRALSDEDLTEYRKLLDGKAPQEKVDEFLNAKIPDVGNMFAQAMLDFRKSYLGLES